MIQLTSIQGNGQWLDGGSMFGNAPRALWEKWTEVDDRGRIPLACRCLLIEMENKKILCEAGIGAFFEPKLADRFGVQQASQNQLLTNLADQDHSPDDIDYVILSHLHFDHTGGLLPTYQEMQNGQKGLVFDNAQYIVGKEAWQRACNPHFRDKASFIPELNKRLQDSGRLRVLEPGEIPEDLKGIIDFYHSSGHTPGQMHTIIHGEKSDMIYAGDLIPGKAWVHLPITMGYDRYPEKLIEEKQQLYNRFSEKSLMLFFTHDPQFAAGLLGQNQKGHYQVSDPIEELRAFSL